MWRNLKQNLLKDLPAATWQRMCELSSAKLAKCTFSGAPEKCLVAAFACLKFLFLCFCFSFVFRLPFPLPTATSCLPQS